MSHLDAYDSLECVSRDGPHSQVFKAHHLETGTEVAIKVIRIFDLHPTLRKECEVEVSLLQSLDHPNLIKYYEHFNHDNDLYIVMELASGGHMAQKIDNTKKANQRIEESLLWRWAYDVASGLAYMHARRVLHRDVKPSHIFLSENGQAKLGDFGLSKIMAANVQIAFSCVGTPFYMSPEIVKSEGYSFGSDIWSLGCSIYELATCYPPFYRNNMDFFALGDAICTARYPPLSPDTWSKDFIAFIRDTLTVDPANRPTAQHLLDLAACKLVGRIQDFKILGTIGRGKFSEVHRVLWTASSDREVALKRVQIFEMDSEARKECITEVNLLKSLNHSTIIRYLDSFSEDAELVIVLELAAHGDLANFCRSLKQDGRTLTENHLWAVFVQVSDALHYMHKSRIMHRDIKPANIFLCSRGVVKLGDLGLGRYFSSMTYQAHSVVGTPFYMSPEVITNSCGYSFKSDIWSLGCVLYELTAGDSPFASSRLDFYALGNRIRKGEYAALPEGTSMRICGLCKEMLQVQPDLRPFAQDVFENAKEYFSLCMQHGSQDVGRIESGEGSRVSRELTRAAAVSRELFEAPQVSKDIAVDGVRLRGTPPPKSAPLARSGGETVACSASAAGRRKSGAAVLGTQSHREDGTTERRARTERRSHAGSLSARGSSRDRQTRAVAHPEGDSSRRAASPGQSNHLRFAGGSVTESRKQAGLPPLRPPFPPREAFGEGAPKSARPHMVKHSSDTNLGSKTPMSRGVSPRRVASPNRRARTRSIQENG